MSKNSRNRCNRVTLVKKSFYYIDLQSYIIRKQICNVTRVYVTNRSLSVLKGGALTFFIKIFFWLYINKAVILWQTIAE